LTAFSSPERDLVRRQPQILHIEIHFAQRPERTVHVLDAPQEIQGDLQLRHIFDLLSTVDERMCQADGECF
jgi:hypothetical protein